MNNNTLLLIVIFPSFIVLKTKHLYTHQVMNSGTKHHEQSNKMTILKRLLRVCQRLKYKENVTI